MFLSQKRVFAGKQLLHQKPFCPVLTTESGFLSLRRSLSDLNNHAGALPNARYSTRDGKRHS